MVGWIGGDEGREEHDGQEPFDEASAETQPLPLGEEERLPWLESADDVDYDDAVPGSRMVGFIILGVLALAVLIGGLYWFTHRGSALRDADGSLIEARKEPYKVVPENPGGKTFEGTGDSSFKVSEGEKPQARVADAGSAAKAAPPAAKPSARQEAPGPSIDTSGVGVQVGAYSSRAAAEAGWGKLTAQYEALKGVNHRTLEGKADIGTVYRLQAVADSAGAANALCGKLRAAGAACQVK